MTAGTYSFNSASKTLSIPTTLNLGTNVFEVVATNQGGSVQSTTSIAYRVKDVPCNDPIITLINPSSAVSTTDEGNFSISF